MWALAPSQADARADRGGVPSRSVIRSSWSQTEALLQNMLEVIWHFKSIYPALLVDLVVLLSPAEWGSEPGRGCVVPAAPRRCSPLTTHQWLSHSAGSPSALLVPCSTVSPPPGSCDVTGLAPPPAPGRNHKSAQKQSCVLIERLRTRQ